MMKKELSMILVGTCLVSASTCLFGADNTPSLAPLQGNWSVTKSRNGQDYSQVIEISKDQLTFQIISADGQVRLYAKGTIKAEKAGPFDVLQLTNIKGGRAADDLQDVDDTRAIVYSVRDGRLYLAVNFDRERENEKPTADEYTLIAKGADTAKPAASGEDAVLGTWKLVATIGENSRDYELRLSKADGKLAGTLVSPRSGEYKCKTVQFKDGELLVEVDRDIGGNQATLILKAKLTAEGLSGNITAKGFEEMYNGTIKATK